MGRELAIVAPFQRAQLASGVAAVNGPIGAKLVSVGAGRSDMFRTPREDGDHQQSVACAV